MKANNFATRLYLNLGVVLQAIAVITVICFPRLVSKGDEVWGTIVPGTYLLIMCLNNLIGSLNPEKDNSKWYSINCGIIAALYASAFAAVSYPEPMVLSIGIGFILVPVVFWRLGMTIRFPHFSYIQMIIVSCVMFSGYLLVSTYYLLMLGLVILGSWYGFSNNNKLYGRTQLWLAIMYGVCAGISFI